MDNYFAVETKCGHVGKGKCIYIWFAVKATDAKAAAAKAREYKRVKHHHKDAIRQVRRITGKEYIELQMSNSMDGYLHCKNVQQQRKLENFANRVEPDLYWFSLQNKPTHKRDVAYILKKNKIRLREILLQIKEAASV